MKAPSTFRILVIDDMPSLHEDYRKILSARPAANGLEDAEAALFGDAPQLPEDCFELDSAYQGSEGLSLVEASLDAGRPYAMAFVDMRMPPGWDGLETVERLWRIAPQIQIVICTAYTDHPWSDVLERLDVRDRLLILKKPFDVIEVSQLARTLAAKWELARQAASQMRRLEDAVLDLKETEGALRQSNKELEAFAYSVSHDLRTPLSIMNAFSRLLVKELGNHASKTVQHYLSRIQANAATGAQLIDDLLSLARVSRAEMDIGTVDLSAITHELINKFRKRNPQHTASVTVQDGLLVQGDRQLLRGVMQRLLDNAWKFSSLQAHAKIEVGRHDTIDGDPVFFVRDNGGGFEMAYVGKLFSLFQRLHPVDEFPGTGAGLVTVSRIIGRHGGRIWAESAIGKGSTFYFTVPGRSLRRLSPVPA